MVMFQHLAVLYLMYQTETVKLQSGILQSLDQTML